jgi:hypothetical protein
MGQWSQNLGEYTHLSFVHLWVTKTLLPTYSTTRMDFMPSFGSTEATKLLSPMTAS